MQRIILIKHSLPEVIKGRPAHTWRLGEEGLRRCKALADILYNYDLKEIISSSEPKAVQTAQEAAHLLGLTQRAVPGLHEHERETMPFFEEHQQFEKAVEHFFDHPTEVVLGEESAEQSYQRFQKAVNGIFDEYAVGDLAIVAHGTVISLFVSRQTGKPAFPLWQSLGLPGMVVLDRANFEILEIIPEIGT